MLNSAQRLLKNVDNDDGLKDGFPDARFSPRFCGIVAAYDRLLLLSHAEEVSNVTIQTFDRFACERSTA